jgi:YD repeat-containing protein
LSPFDLPPLYFDAVESATRNGQTWHYDAGFTIGSLPYNSAWARDAIDPRGGIMRDAKGNSTPGTEHVYGGSIQQMHLRDGSAVDFAWSVGNQPATVTTPLGIKTQYAYDSRGNLLSVTRNPANSSAPVIVQSATYPTTCSNMKTCNKPTAAIDGNGNQTDFTYDPSHGGTLTATLPGVAGGRPETRYTYVQRKAWYRGTNGVMAADPNAIWVLSTESFCAAGSSCMTVTTYDYGPDSGPNNLLVRGKAIGADGTTLRTCYGHDPQGNKIWETSPNAKPSSCPAY